MLGCINIKICIPDWFRLHLTETIEIQLPRKRGKLVVIKILGNNIGRKEIRVFDHEHFPIRSPIYFESKFCDGKENQKR
jgi:hypothetical protein